MNIKHISARPAVLCAVLCALLLVAGRLSADDHRSFSLLWSGSWEFNAAKTTGSLVDRFDARAFLPWQGLSLRGQLIDKRTAPPWVGLDEGITAIGGGLYHAGTGSRLLYGTLSEYGLPARIRSPWIRAEPFVENHQPTVSDLRTEPTATLKNQAYLYLGSPWFTPWFISGQKKKAVLFNAFASATVDGGFGAGSLDGGGDLDSIAAAFSAGVESKFGKKSNFRLEGFYTGRELPPRSAATWFSEKPPLPARDFRIFAASAAFTNPLAAFAADWAYSDTAAFGTGAYANLGVRIGSRPWAVSFAADGASERYVGRDGSVPGAGLRGGAKFEYFGKKSSLFRLGTNVRSSELDMAFDRGSANIYYRLPVSAKGSPVKFTRASLSASRNASDGKSIHDSYEAAFGMNLWKVRSSFSATLLEKSALPDDSAVFPYPIPGGVSFGSFKASADASYSLGMFRFGARASYLTQAGKPAVWDGSLSAAAQTKRGRIGLKVSAADFPEKWAYTLSWRYAY
jgi:hypothetical protein